MRGIAVILIIILTIGGCTSAEVKGKIEKKKTVKEKSIAWFAGYDYEDIYITKVDRIKKWVEKTFPEEYSVISEGIEKDKKRFNWESCITQEVIKSSERENDDSIIVKNLELLAHENAHKLFRSDDKAKEFKRYLFKSEVLVPEIKEEVKSYLWYEESVLAGNSTGEANEMGIYGLMDEYNSYNIGNKFAMKIAEKIYVNYKNNNLYSDIIFDALLSFEFKYYILKYIEFTKNKSPKLYRIICSDEELKEYIYKTDKEFSERLGKYAPEKKIEKLSDFQNIKEIKKIIDTKYKKIYEEFLEKPYIEIS